MGRNNLPKQDLTWFLFLGMVAVRAIDFKQGVSVTLNFPPDVGRQPGIPKQLLASLARKHVRGNFFEVSHA